MQVGAGVLSTPELVAVADLSPGDRLYQVPAGPDTAVLVRVREDEAPLMFATSCGLLSSFDLPTGWEERCLERIVDGQLQKGVFLYSTVE